MEREEVLELEEINPAIDGGVYAERIQYRGFEEANVPPARPLENGFLIPPRTPSRRR